MTYDEWLAELIEICDNERENFDAVVEDYSFHTDWKNGLTPLQSYEHAVGFK